jgi:ribosomal-protein-serine acetyltransferase
MTGKSAVARFKQSLAQVFPVTHCEHRADDSFPHRISPELSLEILELRHANDLYLITDANREHLRQWLPWVDAMKDVADTRAFIQTARRQMAANNGFQTVVRYRGDLVGAVGHHGINRNNRSTSLGYWLTHDAQGKGIMTQSCRLYLQHAFTDLAIHRVEIRCAAANTRSRALPERLGFRSEGVVRDAEWLYDHFVDHVIYGLLAPEWKQSIQNQESA